MPGSFLDSNVLLYLASGNAAKADKAEALLAQGGAISVQVLNEIANVARRKMGMSMQETRAFIAPLRLLFSVHPLTVETHETGLALTERYGFSTWDAMIVASALLAGCNVLWTEDLQDGMEIAGGLRVRNPFG